MIRFSHILKEAPEQEINNLLEKIKQKQFTFFNKGDNGRIYEIDGTDYLFKITTELDEYRCASVIVGRHSEYSTFIPVYYVDGKRMYIMSKADDLSGAQQQQLQQFFASYKQWQRETRGEQSVFDFAKTDVVNETDPKLINFINALETDVQRTGIPEFDLDIDFRPDNVMSWNGNLVMIDW
jgi:hypothetical protein